MNIRDIMNPTAETISPSTTVKEATSMMAKQNIGFLLVAAEDRLKGTLTDRDIVQRVVAEGKDINTTRIEDILTNRILYCEADQDVNDVARNMSEQKVRRMPVVDQNKQLVGVVSIGDMAQHLEKDKVGDLLCWVTSEGRDAA